MISFSPSTPEFWELSELFHETFDDCIPTMMMPSDETFEGLKEKVYESIRQGKNLLSEYYKFQVGVLY
ncbi:hypothetical protein AGMMS49975_29600 [Clostridia bacterium]|nr:hypothetical protein AGMMS49975_29600 [Clostridia bacterium]